MQKYIHCCLDLELEQPRSLRIPDSNVTEEKIIQVGYVIYRVEPGFELIESVSRFVNIGVPLSTFIKALTGIRDSEIAKGIEPVQIYDELVSKQSQYRFLRVIKQWGGGDMDCLRRELPFGIEWQFGRSGFNVKHLYQIYAEKHGMNRSGGLSKCMNRCGLKWEGRGKHNAEIDALNTARFHAILYNKITK